MLRKNMLKVKQKGWLKTPILLLSLMWTIQFQACAKRISYPPFPMMTPHVAEVMRQVGDKNRDPEVWEWLNKLRVLCIQLGTCKR